jgi:two-component system response regulator (stage 0 sporulation protein A)
MIAEMGKKIKIVVADDNRSLCQMLQDFLHSQEDLQVVGLAYNGIEAWDLIQSQEPDLVIIDLVMPSLDGLGVLERINARASVARPKVIMLTAFGQEDS